MYIRKSEVKGKNRTYTNYLLVESVSTPKGPRQKVICSLGDLSPRPRAAWLKLAHKVESALAGQEAFLGRRDPEVEKIVAKVRAREACGPAPGGRAAGAPPLQVPSEEAVSVLPGSVRSEQPREGGPLHYDLTSTYFEGQALGVHSAKRGYSRDKRPDCKQVVVGLVVSREGFPLAHEIFEGNTQDRKSLGTMLDVLGARVGLSEGQLVVVDRGMAFEENLKQITSRGLRYLVAARQSERDQWIEEFEQAESFVPVIRPNSPWNEGKTKPEVRVALKTSGQEAHVLCHSEGRTEKDRAIRLKTDRTDLTADEAWRIYVLLTRAEAAFRAMKSPLCERPIFHKLQRRVETHIFLCVLAYHLMVSIEHTFLNRGVHTSWATVREILSTHQVVTTVLPTDDGAELRIRKGSTPEPEHKEIYDLLGVPHQMVAPRRTWSLNPPADSD